MQEFCAKHLNASPRYISYETGEAIGPPFGCKILFNEALIGTGVSFKKVLVSTNCSSTMLTPV